MRSRSERPDRWAWTTQSEVAFIESMGAHRLGPFSNPKAHDEVLSDGYVERCLEGYIASLADRSKVSGIDIDRCLSVAVRRLQAVQRARRDAA